MAMFGPLWGGASYDHIMVGAPYWIGALILGGAFLLMLRVRPAVHALAPAIVDQRST
jgi:hypothetical protein